MENDGIETLKEVPVGILPVNMLEHFPHGMSSTRGSLNNRVNWMTGQGRNGSKEGTGAIKVGLYDMNSLLSKRPYGLVKELHALKSDASVSKRKVINTILKQNRIPESFDINLESDELVTLNMVKVLFEGAGLKPDL